MIHRWTSAVLATGALCAALAMTAAQPAFAAGPGAGPAPGLSAVDPGPGGYFQLAEPAEGRATVAIVVHNLSAARQTYRIYPTDATTSPATGVQYGQRHLPAAGVGAWLQPSTTLLTLGQGQSAEVKVVVHVPAGVLPGDHVGGIAAENLVQPQPAVVAGRGGAAAELITTTRVILAVVVRTPGPAAAGMRVGNPRLGTVNGARQFLQFPMDDTGLLLFKLRLTSVVTTCSGGAPVLSVNRQLDTFVPRTAIGYDYYLQQNLPAGCYRAVTEIFDGSTLLSRATGRFTVSSAEAAVRPRRGTGPKMPALLLLLLVVAGVLFLMVIALVFLLLGRRRRDEPPAARPRGPGAAVLPAPRQPVKVSGRHRA